MGSAALRARVDDYLASLAALGLARPSAPVITALDDRNWSEAWREHFRPLPVGRRLLVAPPWDVPADTDRVLLVIEPGRAFGTGHHGSTAGCLTLIERVVERERPSSAIDLGTGSGILAIAAVKLGVGAVLAVDNDPDAVAVAAANADVNGVASRIDCRRQDAGALAAAATPLVIANLLTAAHLRLAADYGRMLTAGGALLLGGILDAEADSVRERLRAEGFSPADHVRLDGWSSLELRAPVHDRR